MMERYGAKVQGGTVVDVLVLADGAKGDEALTALSLVEQAEVYPGIGWSWDGEQFAPPIVSLSWDDIRRQRSGLLAACDWTQITDTPLTDAQVDAWADYRQALRDIPQNFDTPDDVVWPVAP